MHVTDRHGERIGRIVRRGRLCEPKQQLDHLLHLALFRATIAHHRPLHLCGRVLNDRAPRLDGRKKCDAARVPKLQCAARVDRVKHALDSDAVGPRLRQQCNEFAMNARQASGKGVSCGGRDGTARHKAMTASVRLHATVAGALGAGIDADDSHAREASISFSSISKLAQTCWTSSWSSSASISFSMTEASLPVSFM